MSFIPGTSPWFMPMCSYDAPAGPPSPPPPPGSVIAPPAAFPSPNQILPYTSPVNVSLATVAGAVIYYTLDGTEPLPSSTVYSGPIRIAHTVTLNAIAVLNGVSSYVASYQYRVL